jgi:hypothetical protein
MKYQIIRDESELLATHYIASKFFHFPINAQDINSFLSINSEKEEPLSPPLSYSFLPPPSVVLPFHSFAE